LDIDLLKTFLEVSKRRHFGRAAEALYLTQSAVSFRVRQLENQLKVNLFIRSRHNIQLTEAGERLLPYAQNLINTWQEALNIAAQTPLTENLTLGASSAIWESYLGIFLPKWYQDHNPISIEARIGHRDLLISELQEHQLDLMITTEATKMDELMCQKVGEINLALFASRPHAEGISLPYIRVDWGQSLANYPPEGSGNSPQPIFTTSSARMALELMREIPSSCLLPIEWGEKDKLLQSIKSLPTVIRPVYLVSLHNSGKQDKIKAWLSTLMNRVSGE
jgi:LysR family transcriptional regulator, flagellar master operon regulator